MAKRKKSELIVLGVLLWLWWDSRSAKEEDIEVTVSKPGAGRSVSASSGFTPVNADIGPATEPE